MYINKGKLLLPFCHQIILALLPHSIERWQLILLVAKTTATLSRTTFPCKIKLCNLMQPSLQLLNMLIYQRLVVISSKVVKLQYIY